MGAVMAEEIGPEMLPEAAVHLPLNPQRTKKVRLLLIIHNRIPLSDATGDSKETCGGSLRILPASQDQMRQRSANLSQL